MHQQKREQPVLIERDLQQRSLPFGSPLSPQAQWQEQAPCAKGSERTSSWRHGPVFTWQRTAGGEGCSRYISGWAHREGKILSESHVKVFSGTCVWLCVCMSVRARCSNTEQAWQQPSEGVCGKTLFHLVTVWRHWRMRRKEEKTDGRKDGCSQNGKKGSWVTTTMCISACR